MTDSSTDPVDRFLDAARDETAELPFRLTGVMFQYYVVCERELWFLSRDVEIDRDTPSIVRGSDVDDSAYSDKRRDVRVDGIIAIDVLDSGEILEVKPSSSMTEPARLQLLFYLWYLDRVTGVEKTGVLAHPTEKRRETIELTPETSAEVESAIRGIREVVTAESPPPAEGKPVCDSCAYHDFCWSC
ncbi:CRISPR-associated protein Cas4 [Natrinema saccharevitans]|uniref:CRISPR-associated exonuclease Cas4 n=1 Tax=Natrinema saccharevitans TaxID=301967 RepID=A0A1S8AWL8_9EURY|nr:CRISPR-associated protein Cas4 [Natrinema saccharevitans]OLZ40949.1 CRISPR-associated protein Cas4 [Natrinema saccharevitans]